MDKQWNLQDIKPTSTRKKTVRTVKTRKVEDSPRVAAPSSKEDYRKPERTSSGKKPGWLLVVAVMLVVLLGGFIISFLMGGAEVTVFPRHREPTVNSVFTAYKTPQTGDLSYEIMSLEAEGERQVAATGEEEVSVQATGEISIYKLTEGSERLIKNTRFESSNGLVYRITESVVVPGASKASDGSMTPGSIKAKVFADQAGENYNLSANTKFTVPGFKEGGYEDLYKAIYATNDSALTGGYEGTRYTVDDDELAGSTDGLRNELKDSLLARIENEKPSGFIVFPNAVTITFETLPPTDAGNGQAAIKEKATLRIPMFKSEDFAAFIAKSTIPGYENEPVKITNPNSLSFAYDSTSTTNTNIADLESISFKLTGDAEIIWTFDEAKLKQDLAGSSKTALTSILGGYPAIEKAEAVVRPFWKRSFPDSIEEIQVTESLDGQ